jgi:hypothetical protein
MSFLPKFSVGYYLGKISNKPTTNTEEDMTDTAQLAESSEKTSAPSDPNPGDKRPTPADFTTTEEPKKQKTTAGKTLESLKELKEASQKIQGSTTETDMPTGSPPHKSTSGKTISGKPPAGKKPSKSAKKTPKSSKKPQGDEDPDDDPGSTPRDDSEDDDAQKLPISVCKSIIGWSLGPQNKAYESWRTEIRHKAYEMSILGQMQAGELEWIKLRRSAVHLPDFSMDGRSSNFEIRCFQS